MRPLLEDGDSNPPVKAGKGTSNMAPDFGKLEQLSKTLNEDSNELTKILGEINSKLNALNLGVEVWLDNQLYEDRLPRDEYGPGMTASGYLGYGKFGDSWGLLVRQTREKERGDGELSLESENYRFLLESSREVRLSAVDLIPDLITELESEAEETRTAVSKAKELASML